MTGIVLGWGLALIPLGLPTPLWAGLAAFFAGAVIWGPWTSLSMAVFQDAAPPGALTQVIAARSSLLILARSEEHTSELQSRRDLVCRLLLEKKKKKKLHHHIYKKKKKKKT